MNRDEIIEKMVEKIANIDAWVVEENIDCVDLDLCVEDIFELSATPHCSRGCEKCFKEEIKKLINGGGDE